MTVQAGLVNFVPLISQWKLQSQDDICDAVNDWGYGFTFLCVMNDGVRMFANGFLDEGADGSCTKYVEFERDDYNTDDLLYWMEIPTPPLTELVERYGEDKIASAIKEYRQEYVKELVEENK